MFVSAAYSMKYPQVLRAFCRIELLELVENPFGAWKKTAIPVMLEASIPKTFVAGPLRNLNSDLRT